MIESLAWPGAVVLICVIFMLIFRSSIRSFIDRCWKISPSGAEAYPPEPQQRAEATAAREITIRQDAEEKSTVLKEIEENIRRQLENESKDIIFEKMASLVLQSGINFTYSQIFGSQLALLVNLNSRPDGQLLEEFSRYYDVFCTRAKNMFPQWENLPTLEQYIDFLKSQGLITFKEGKYYITNLGREFLVSLVRTGRTGERLL